MQHYRSELQYYRPKELNVKELVQNNESYRFFIYILSYISIFLCVIASFKTNSVNISLFISMTTFLLCSIAVSFYFNPEKHDEKEAVIENNPKKDYLISLGVEVKKFYGDAVKSGKAANNKIRPILINAETVKRHFLCMATIGAGKSVLMKGLIEQYVLLGGGMLIVDGKGTDEFAKEIYGLIASLGREDDFVCINFLDMDNTHTINPLLSGSALSIYEMMLLLLVGEENEWKEKQKEFMKCILKLMVYKRDNEPDFIFDFSALTEVLVLKTLVQQALKYRNAAKTNVGVMDFIKYVTSTIEITLDEFMNGDEKDPKWVESVMKKCNGDGQGIYDVSVCVGAWRNVITNLSSDYGRIFNSPNPDISLWEATQRNKIIFISLPTMDSDTTPKELGRLILGLIKGVAAQKVKFAKEPKIPFVCFLDELGSYINEGFGLLGSKSRSLGISIVPFFQSPAQIDVIAKNDYERKQIIDITGVHILMKNMHPDTTEFYAKMVEKKKVMSRDFTARREYTKGSGAVEDTYKVEEKDAIEHNEVVNMNNGEMIVFANGRMHRTIAQAESSLLTQGKKTTYKMMSDDKIPLTQYVNKIKFLSMAYQVINAIKKGA